MAHFILLPSLLRTVIKVFSLLPLGKGLKMRTPKTYLVRKDITKPFGPDNWYIFTGPEYYEFKETPEFSKCRRYFTKVNTCEGGGDIIFAECEHEKYLEYERERNKQRYREKQRIEAGITIVSLEEEFEELPNASFCFGYNELLTGDSASAEDVVIASEMQERLLYEVDSLPHQSREIIEISFLGDKKLSGRKCARKLGVCKTALIYQKNKALGMLSKKMADWRNE